MRSFYHSNYSTEGSKSFFSLLFLGPTTKRMLWSAGPISLQMQRSTSKSLEMDLFKPHSIDISLFKVLRSVQPFPCIFMDEVLAPYVAFAGHIGLRFSRTRSVSAGTACWAAFALHNRISSEGNPSVQAQSAFHYHIKGFASMLGGTHTFKAAIAFSQSSCFT